MLDGAMCNVLIPTSGLQVCNGPAENPSHLLLKVPLWKKSRMQI